MRDLNLRDLIGLTNEDCGELVEDHEEVWARRVMGGRVVILTRHFSCTRQGSKVPLGQSDECVSSACIRTRGAVGFSRDLTTTGYIYLTRIHSREFLYICFVCKMIGVLNG